MVRCELVNSTSTSKDMIICLNSNPPLGKILYKKQLQITHQLLYVLLMFEITKLA